MQQVHCKVIIFGNKHGLYNHAAYCKVNKYIQKSLTL